MLKTLEAIYDPKQGLVFSEPFAVQQPVKVLVTILEPTHIPIQKGSLQALLTALRGHSLSASARYQDSKIEAQVAEARESWE